MAKVAVLKLEMLRASLACKQGLSMSTIDALTHNLREWHGNLPPQMHLLKLNNNSVFTGSLRHTSYYVHLLYFGAMILLARQVVQQTNDGMLDNLPQDSKSQSAYLFVTEATSAARESAHVLYRLQAEGGLFQHCWVCM